MTTIVSRIGSACASGKSRVSVCACACAQSTSVLGHRRRAGSADARLALSEAERARLQAQHDTTAAAHHYRLHDDLHQHFDQVAAPHTHTPRLCVRSYYFKLKLFL